MAEMLDFKVNLETSPYLQLRQYLLSKHQAPKLSQANKTLGENLANLLFQHCDEALKENFGLTKPLKGPGNNLWTSPSDLLLGKLALKPPYTPKCLQALTHSGILEIGYGLEQKFKQEMETDKLRCLQAYKDELLSSVETRIRSEIKDVEIRERLNCHMELEKLTQDYEINLKNELKLLEEKLQAQYKELLKKQESHIQDEWNKILEVQVDKTVEQMTQEFLIQLDEQEEILTKNFGLELRKREALRKFDAKMNKQKTRRALRQLKHNLECTSLVNMMYILCSERQKCCQEKEKIENYYKIEIDKLKKIMQRKDDDLSKLEKAHDQKTKDIEIREILLTEILKQFQKFINFALKSAPTQAEFLLSVEKMMVFELTNAISKKEFLSFTNKNAILSGKHSDEKSLTTTEASSLRTKEFDDCQNEVNPFKKADNDIPVGYFEGKRCVREEFRDNPSAKVDLPPDSNLWNKDVQILVDTWRKEHQSKNSLNEDDLKYKEREDIIEKEDSGHSAKGDQKSRRSSTQREKSTVQFKTVTGGAISSRSSRLNPQPAFKSEVDGDFETTTNFERRSVGSTSIGKRLSFKRPSLKTNPICKLTTDIQFEENTPNVPGSNLLATRDSFEIIREKSKSRYSVLMVSSADRAHYHTSNTEELLVEIIDQDSDGKEMEDDKLKTLKNNEALTKESIVSEKIVLDSSHLEHSSKEQELVLEARDSIILQKVSLLKKSSTANFNASPVDSIELAKELKEKSVEGIRSKSSKLTSARNSVDFLKESLAKLYQPSAICTKRNKLLDSSQSLMVPMSPCCEKCKKEAIVLEENKSQSERSVKISHIEVIDIQNEETNIGKRTNSMVSFQRKATVYHTPDMTSRIRESATLKKPLRKSSNAKRLPPKPPTYYDAYPLTKIQVLGDPNASEGTQSVHEFTKDRIHSLVNLMKKEPYLMQLFTSCRR